MKVLLLISLSAVASVVCQTKNGNGNPTGEIGYPAFDEIVVHSSLNVRGKSLSSARGSKALVSESGTKMLALSDSNSNATDSATLSLKRPKRTPKRSNGGYRHGGYQGPAAGFGGFPGSSSSSSQASSNAFNQNTPFGSFGASASQSASQSQGIGPNGFQAASGQSASQTYRLPNGNQIDVAFSSGFSSGNKGGPSFSNSHAITVTRPNGQKYQYFRKR